MEILARIRGGRVVVTEEERAVLYRDSAVVTRLFEAPAGSGAWAMLGNILIVVKKGPTSK